MEKEKIHQEIIEEEIIKKEIIKDEITKISKFEAISIQFKKSFVIMKKNLRIYYNKPPVLIQGIFFPIILFFSFTIGRNIPPLYLISGLIAMEIFLTSTSIGPIVLPWETMRRTLERLITSPISIQTILLADLWSSSIYGVLFSTIPLIIGVIFFSEVLSINLLIIIPGLIIGSLVFGTFSLIISIPPATSPGNTMIMQMFLKFPILFVSPIYMPISGNPAFFISPITYFVDLMNLGLGGVSIFGSFGLFAILIDLGILMAYGIIFLMISFVFHKKTLEMRFKD